MSNLKTEFLLTELSMSAQRMVNNWRNFSGARASINNKLLEAINLLRNFSNESWLEEDKVEKIVKAIQEVVDE